MQEPTLNPETPMTTPTVNKPIENGAAMETSTDREVVDWENELAVRVGLEIAEANKGNYEADFVISYVKKLIRQTHLDLLSEVLQEVVGEDDFEPVDNDGEFYSSTEVWRNTLRSEQRIKLSHIITRVEGEGK